MPPAPKRFTPHPKRAIEDFATYSEKSPMTSVDNHYAQRWQEDRTAMHDYSITPLESKEQFPLHENPALAPYPNIPGIVFITSTLWDNKKPREENYVYHEVSFGTIGLILLNGLPKFIPPGSHRFEKNGNAVFIRAVSTQERWQKDRTIMHDYFITPLESSEQFPLHENPARAPYPNIPGILCITSTLWDNKKPREEDDYVYHEVSFGTIGLVLLNGLPEFIPPGSHRFEKNGNAVFIRAVSTQERYFQHGAIHFLNVGKDALYYFKNSKFNTPFKLLTAGIHLIKEENAVFFPVLTSHDGMELRVNLPEKGNTLLFVTIAAGEAGVLYYRDEDGRPALMMLAQGVNSVWEGATFHGRFRHSGIKTQFMVQGQKTLWDLSGRQPRETVHSVETSEGIPVNLSIAVEYRYISPFDALSGFAPPSQMLSSKCSHSANQLALARVEKAVQELVECELKSITRSNPIATCEQVISEPVRQALNNQLGVIEIKSVTYTMVPFHAAVQEAIKKEHVAATVATLHASLNPLRQEVATMKQRYEALERESEAMEKEMQYYDDLIEKAMDEAFLESLMPAESENEKAVDALEASISSCEHLFFYNGAMPDAYLELNDGLAPAQAFGLPDGP